MQVNHATDDLIISQAVLVYVPLKPTGARKGNVNSSQYVSTSIITDASIWIEQHVRRYQVGSSTNKGRWA